MFAKELERKVVCKYKLLAASDQQKEAESRFNDAKKAAAQASRDCEEYRRYSLTHAPNEQTRLFLATRLVEAYNSMLLAAEAVESANVHLEKTKARLATSRQRIDDILAQPLV